MRHRDFRRLQSVSLLLPVLIVAAAVAPALVARDATTPAIAAQSASSNAIDPKFYQDLRWRNVGPTRGGRVTAIAGVRSQPCTFYMGADRWRRLEDRELRRDTGCRSATARSPPDRSARSTSPSPNPNIVYVGTGSAAIRSNVIIGRGAYKSTDAGKTWQFMGLKDAGPDRHRHRPPDQSRHRVARGARLAVRAERRARRLQDDRRRQDLEEDAVREQRRQAGACSRSTTSNPNELYAGMYRGFRKGWDIISGGPATEGGIYKSTDGGDTWKKLSSGLPRAADRQDRSRRRAQPARTSSTR